jgi:four helix bundle protein
LKRLKRLLNLTAGIFIAGSTTELETQILLSAELGYLKAPAREQLLSEIDTVGKMLRGLHKSLVTKDS